MRMLLVITVLVTTLLHEAGLCNIYAQQGTKTFSTENDLMLSLRNQNERPRISKGTSEQTVVFPKNFDWEKQDLVIETIKAVAANPEESWEPMLDHLKDENYCITLELSQSTHNLSVGDIVDILLLESITAAYIDLIPSSPLKMGRFSNCLGEPRDSALVGPESISGSPKTLPSVLHAP